MTRAHVDPPPLDAATVVIIRRPRPNVRELYFVHRAAQSPFMPSTWVFPGGRVDSADGPAGSDDAFLRAATRECQEEAGLTLDPSRLTWIDTWQTPSAEPRRYTARFFLAEIAYPDSERAQIDGHEIIHGAWKSPTAMLNAWHAGEADLPPPTICLLQFLAASVALPFDPLADELAAPILPKRVVLDERPTIVMPHDPAYGEMPGLGAAIPRRSNRFPRRLERRNERWVPCD